MGGSRLFNKLASYITTFICSIEEVYNLVGNSIQSELDSILSLLENPTRRKIIKSLSQESNYPLQLAKNLGLGQQLVAKHLRVMEEAGLVSSTMISSPQGPERRMYTLKKNISVTVDVAPHLFNAKVLYFAEPEKEEISEHSALLIERIEEISGYAEDKERMGLFSKVLKEIDERIEELGNERVVLLNIRNFAMNEASKIMERIEDPDARRVLYHVLNGHDENIMNTSEILNLRESLVHQILERLKKDFDLT